MADIKQAICYNVVIVMFVVSITSSAKDRLVLVQAIFRHGDRSPVSTFPNDKHRSYWYRGLGQLTKIKVTSSDFDRTLMSAYCVLSGLYPPKGKEQQWNPDLNWQPIPVHTKPQKEDFIFSLAACPRYQALVQDYRGENTMSNFVATHQDLVEQIMNISGLSKDSWSNIADILYCQYVHNLSLPEWESVLPFNLVTSLRDESASYFLPTQETTKLRGGPLLKEIIENMKRNLNTDSNRKVYLYSGHDTTLIALMQILNVFDRRHPSYSACVIVELWKSGKNEMPFVRILHKNETNNNINILKIPGCIKDCPFNDFVSILANSIPKDIKEDCKNENRSSLLGSSIYNNRIGVFVLICIVILLVIVLAILIIHAYRVSRVTAVYQTVPTEDGYL
ncbi:testicular acid phosphatase homolog isoform X2 [Pecten maximus]|uniref:testicular acid phosphatase homolog isoform X2 n=1 Tax=Pecten maximus TaxID=6579 RepID=UPI001458C633|nr:testicular acid phosphatase homolog isoform X2 [Pecten maximus]